MMVNVGKFSLTINNNRLNGSFSIFWHDGICFEQLRATGKFKQYVLRRVPVSSQDETNKI